jgi:starch synthase
MRSHIVHIANEIAPYYKNGGLGDVVGALSQYLSKEYSNTVIAFYYKDRMKHFKPCFIDSYFIEMLGLNYSFTYYYFRKRNVDYYFLNMEDEYVFCDTGFNNFNGDNPYKNLSSTLIYLYFAKAALKLIQLKIGSLTTIICHDWHGAGIFGYPTMLKDISKRNGINVFTIILIHNYGHQGNVYEDVFQFLEEEPLVLFKKIFTKFGSATLLSLAIENADYILTVSSNYANEIKEGIVPHEGIKYIINSQKKIYGLMNGVDYSVWHPTSSPYLAQHYNSNLIKKKLLYKKQVFDIFGFGACDSKEIPLILFMCRLTEQKGINLFFDRYNQSQDEAIEFIKKILELNIKLVIYGKPSDGIYGKIHKSLKLISSKFQDSFYYSPDYNDENAHLLLAAADIILMPSLYEPCGLTQLYAMAFGTIPIVRPVGGLKDSVKCYFEKENEATGFYMDSFCRESLYKTTKRAIELFKCRPYLWKQLQLNAMKQDFSWEKNIKPYFHFINEHTIL